MAGRSFRSSCGDQLLGFDVQRSRKGFQRFESSITPPGFQTADIGSRAPRNERQLLLREFSFPSETLHVQAEHSAQFHPTRSAAMSTVVRHTPVNIPR